MDAKLTLFMMLIGGTIGLYYLTDANLLRFRTIRRRWRAERRD